MIAGGRHTTGVKKVWVIAAEKSDDRKFTKKITEKAFENTDMVQEITRQPEISCYSIEWAGFVQTTTDMIDDIVYEGFKVIWIVQSKQ